MASVVLRSAGAAVGNAILPGIGGAFLGSIGRSFGGMIDGQLGLGTQVTGPRLDNLSVQDSRYGAGIPLAYGSMRIAGNVIWSTDLIEAQHTSSLSGGKGGFGGGVSETTYTYSVHCAVGIALGPIGGITTIWADSAVIYQNGVWAAGTVDSAAIYTGTATQAADAFMQSILGSANVPAYRGLAYIVLENLQLANFGNRLPNLTFEIVPVPASSNPAWLGGVDANLDQHQVAVTCGSMLPIPVGGSNAEIGAVLAGGFEISGSTCNFEVVEYDVTDTTPVELARVASGTFTAAAPEDIGWALGPDNRTVALYLENTSAVTHNLVIYDTQLQQFGTVYSVNLTAAAGLTKPLAWIDAQHFVIADISGGERGVHVFARAGLDIVDLGFFNVWGSGSATALALFYGAQFTPFAGGLLHYASDASSTTTLTMYACPLAWQNNTLVVGSSYTLASGLALGSGSGPNACFVATGGSEWTLFYGTVVDYRLFSFEPGAGSASITRPWQDFTLSFGTGTTNFPVYYGDRLVIAQAGTTDEYFRLSEVLLGAGSFSLALDGAVVGGVTALTENFNAIALDSSRLLLLASGGVNNDIKQLGIIQRCPTGDGLDAILTDILTRAGYASGDFDVSALAGASVDGYVLQEPTTARAAIEPLQLFQPFDLVESGTLIKAVPRGITASVTIPSSEWRAAQDKQEPPPPLAITRAQELDLPLEVDIDYIDAARNFEVNCQRARRIATQARSVQKIALPMVIDADAAKQIAETRLFTLWAERELVRLTVSRRYLALEPGDVIDLGTGNLLRVTTVHQAGGLMEVEGFYVYAAAQGSAAAADAGQTISASASAPLASTLYLMDLPLLQSTDDQPGLYAAATGLPGWNGATLWRAPDGVNYSNIGSLPQAAIAGIAVTAPGSQSCFAPDRISTVNVQLIQGELSSCGSADLYNGANAALLGGEIIQFETATLIGPGLYTLSNLLRGRRGTEGAAGTHAVGENFVLLTAGTVDFIPALLTDRGSAYEFRALTGGQSLGDAQDSDFTYNLMTIQPFSPANIAGTRASGAGSDLTLVWKRRARLNADWVDYVDVPLDEPVELYEVDIMNGGSAVRTFSGVTSPTQIYTAAEQASDWPGGIPTTFTVNVYQISSRVGRGQVGAAVV